MSPFWSVSFIQNFVDAVIFWIISTISVHHQFVFLRVVIKNEARNYGPMKEIQEMEEIDTSLLTKC